MMRLCVPALKPNAPPTPRRCSQKIGPYKRRYTLNAFLADGNRNFNVLKAHFRRGGLIAYPTESCFGLGCDPRNYQAVRQLLKLKKRPQSKGLILIAADLAHLQNWIGNVSAQLKSRIVEKGERPCTWLVPPGRLARRYLTGQHNTLAIRIIRHPLAARLCRTFVSPIVSTSANLSGKKPLTSAAAVVRVFGGHARVVKGRVGNNKRPSSIRDIVSGKVIR